jgi:molecular chaperone DnaK (HSP70)
VPRGTLQIDVNGILSVSELDNGTGKEQAISVSV